MDKEDKLKFDGIEFNGLEDIINDKTFIQIKKLKEKNDQNSLKRLNKDLKKTRPQFLEYYLKNKETLLKFSNTIDLLKDLKDNKKKKAEILKKLADSLGN